MYGRSLLYLYVPSWIDANDSSVAPSCLTRISSSPNILPDSVSSGQNKGWWRLVEATISEIPVPRSIDAHFPVSRSKSAVTNSPRGYDIARHETRGLRWTASVGLPGLAGNDGILASKVTHPGAPRRRQASTSNSLFPRTGALQIISNY